MVNVIRRSKFIFENAFFDFIKTPVGQGLKALILTGYHWHYLGIHPLPQPNVKLSSTLKSYSGPVHLYIQGIGNVPVSSTYFFI